jgi:hypothetical protein
MTMRAIQHTMAELSGGRFVLGLGVSHSHLVTGVRGHEYKKPIPAMREYLEAMRAALFRGRRTRRRGADHARRAAPGDAALGARAGARRPSVLHHARRTRRGAARSSARRVARARTEGAPRHRRHRARATARATMQIYLGLPNYQNNLKWLGFTDDDIANGGSDRLGRRHRRLGRRAGDRRSIRAHHDAGANHVCIQPLRPDGIPGPDLGVLEAWRRRAADEKRAAALSPLC